MLRLTYILGIFCFTLLPTADASTGQLEVYRGSECEAVLEGIARDYVAANASTVNAAVESTAPEAGLSLLSASFDLCDIDDLDQGSYDIRRKVAFCTDLRTAAGEIWTGTIYFTTQGDLFCDGEKVVSFDRFWLH